MRWLRADCHVHSVLSPCGDLAMSPRSIAARFRQLGVDVAALADHNCARNLPAWRKAAERMGVTPLFGLEVRSVEEVDVLTIFDDLAAAMAFGEWVWERLPDVPCDPRVFGDQVVVDAADEIEELVDRLLIGGIAASLHEVAEEARTRGALVIPAHVDRAVDSVISQLGFLPADLAVDAVEMSRFGDEQALRGQQTWLERVPVVRFSDAHLPADLGYQQTRFLVAEATVAELRKALEGREGRRVEPVRRALQRRTSDGAS